MDTSRPRGFHQATENCGLVETPETSVDTNRAAGDYPVGSDQPWLSMGLPTRTDSVTRN